MPRYGERKYVQRFFPSSEEGLEYMKAVVSRDVDVSSTGSSYSQPHYVAEKKLYYTNEMGLASSVFACDLKGAKTKESVLNLGDGVFVPPDCCGFISYVKWARCSKTVGTTTSKKKKGFLYTSNGEDPPFVQLIAKGAGIVYPSLFSVRNPYPQLGDVKPDAVPEADPPELLPLDGSYAEHWSYASMSSLDSQELHTRLGNEFSEELLLNSWGERIALADEVEAASKPPHAGLKRLPLSPCHLLVNFVSGQHVVKIERFCIAFFRRNRGVALQRCVLSIRRAFEHNFPLRGDVAVCSTATTASDASLVKPANQPGGKAHRGRTVAAADLALLVAVGSLPVELIVLIYSFIHPFRRTSIHGYIQRFRTSLQNTVAKDDDELVVIVPPLRINKRAGKLLPCDGHSADGRYFNEAASTFQSASATGRRASATTKADKRLLGPPWVIKH